MVSIKSQLETAGLRPTRQRLALAGLLFAETPRHVTAETLHREAVAAGAQVSLATVYNTLWAFSDAGLVRRMVLEGASVVFDTNTEAHHHFLNEDTGEITDIPQDHVALQKVPTPPDGAQVTSVDVVVRVRSRD